MNKETAGLPVDADRESRIIYEYGLRNLLKTGKNRRASLWKRKLKEEPRATTSSASTTRGGCPNLGRDTESQEHPQGESICRKRLSSIHRSQDQEDPSALTYTL